MEGVRLAVKGATASRDAVGAVEERSLTLHPPQAAQTSRPRQSRSDPPCAHILEPPARARSLDTHRAAAPALEHAADHQPPLPNHCLPPLAAL